MVSGAAQAAIRGGVDQKGARSWGMDIAALLTLTPVGPDRYRSAVNQTNYQVAIFGGQLMGQALVAAGATMASKRLHSLHGYFLQAGKPDQPIDYVVQTLRDSGASALRQVMVMQDQLCLFSMQCFFRADQPGFDHQVAALPAPDPAMLEDFAAIARADPDVLGDFGQFILNGAMVEVRPFARTDLRHEPGATRRRFWVRVPGARDVQDEAMHAAMLAYLSDYWFSRVALVPHCSPIPSPAMKFASIDHCMWFHRTVRVDDWLLYDTESPSASDGTGFARGMIYDRAGRLVASTAQEVLQSPRRAGGWPPAVT